MSLVRLKRAPFPTRVEAFDARPSWAELASRITKIFDIPLENVGVAYVDEANKTSTSVVTNELALLEYYDSISEAVKIKFVVVNVEQHDSKFACSCLFRPINPQSAATTIPSSWSSKSHLSDLSGMHSSISSIDHSIS